MAERVTLERGNGVPHFHVRTVTGAVFSYSTIWQRHNLVLVVLHGAEAEAALISELLTRSDEFTEREGICVVTQDRVPGVPAPGALVADRWGEIVHVVPATEVASPQLADDLIEWLDFVRRRCPECEGEFR